MITTEAGIVYKIEFLNEQAKERYLIGLKINGKSYYIISEGFNSGNGKFFIRIVVSDGKHKLMQGITIE